jgi:hypothetical protein
MPGSKATRHHLNATSCKLKGKYRHQATHCQPDVLHTASVHRHPQLQHCSRSNILPVFISNRLPRHSTDVFSTSVEVSGRRRSWLVSLELTNQQVWLFLNPKKLWLRNILRLEPRTSQAPKYQNCCQSIYSYHTSSYQNRNRYQPLS